MSAVNTPSGVPMMSDFGSDFINGAVSLARLLSIYGHEYMEEVDALWATEGTDFIVLFTNDDESEYALLPVGPAHPHKSLSKALELTAGGLHAVCHAAACDGIKPVPLTLPAEGWKKIARAFPAEAEEMETLIVSAGCAEEALLAVLRSLAESKSRLNAQRASALEREENAARREAHVLASAQRIEELMQRYGRWEDLIAQTALLEHREKYVQDVEARLILRAQELELHQEELDQANANLDRRAARAVSDITRAPFPK
jgi:hypothetical protein